MPVIGDQKPQLKGKSKSFQSETAALEPLLLMTLTPKFQLSQEKYSKKTI
jgi:hypothetical protein